MNRSVINVHCDGSCLNNGSSPASAGYGIVVEKDGKIIMQLFGKVRGKQTNNRAELEAILESLKYISQCDEKEFNLYSDSLTAVNGLNGNSQRKSNRDIWQDIEMICGTLTEKKDISIYHVDKNKLDKNDSTYYFNVLADKLAFKGANALIINKRRMS